MAATASAAARLSSPPGAGGLDNEDSNISSPLSEVDDKDDNDEELEHMQLDDRKNITKSSPPTKKEADAGSDSDSVLSDAHSDVHSDANDTEAETERLYDTPKHQRQRDVVVDQYNEGQVFEHTPSKLRSATILDGARRGGDDESLAGDDVSVGSTRGGDESPTKNASTNNTSADSEPKRDSQERKRKRSPAADQSETEQPLRKRTGSVPDLDHEDGLQAEDGPLLDESADPAHESSGTRSPTDDADASPRKKMTPPDDDASERITRAGKKSTRSGSKRKAAASAEADHDTDVGSHDGTRDGATGTDAEQHPGDEIDAEVEDEADTAAAHDEELERKHAAYKDWTQIEDMFGIFRDRLYKDRLQRLEEEEQSLLADVPSHPEYLNMKQCLDDRLEQKIREFNKELEYRSRAHERRAVAQRAQIWGQYYQAVREQRERTLEGLNKEWYDVQTARRSAHSLQDCGLVFPKDPAQRVKNAIAYNTEVSALASIAKYEGFPAGPELRGASQTELEDDLAIIERARHGRHKPQVQQREDYSTTSFDRIGAAGEQFLRETPWANPQHQAHRIYADATPTVEGLANSAANRGAPQDLSTPSADLKATLDNPARKQQSPALSNRQSESPEMTRTKLSNSSHPMKRVGSLSGVNRGPKATAA